MSPLTIFLAKLLGLYCIIAALAMMTRKQSAVATVRGLIASPPLLLLVEVIGLAGGLAMILGHNIWSGGALTGRCHPGRMADGDQGRGAARSFSQHDHEAVRGVAL